MISYEQYCGTVNYGSKIIGKPDATEIKRFLLKMNIHDHHYLGYVAMTKNTSVTRIINELISNYVEILKNNN